MCPPQPAPSPLAPSTSPAGDLPWDRSHRASPGLGALPSISLPPQIQPHTGGVADPIRAQPQPLGLRQPLRTQMGKGQVGAARSWEGTKKGQNQGKNKSWVLPSTLLRSLKTLCRGCSRNWLKVSFAPQKGAGAAVAIAWPPPQQKQALPSKAVSQTPTPPALAGALQRQAD